MRVLAMFGTFSCKTVPKGLPSSITQLRTQKEYFNRKCTFRFPVALVITPNNGVPNVAPGKPKFGMLVSPKNSPAVA